MKNDVNNENMRRFRRKFYFRVLHTPVDVYSQIYGDIRFLYERDSSSNTVGPYRGGKENAIFFFYYLKITVSIAKNN